MERRVLRTLLSDLTQSLRHKHMFEGVPAEKTNQILISQFYEAWLHLASDVLTQSLLSDSSMRKRLSNFAESLQSIEITEVLTICQDAADFLITNPRCSYSDFKGHLYEQHPVVCNLIPGLLSPISALLTQMFECVDSRAVYLRLILIFLRFGKKLTLESKQIQAKALSSYLEVEDKLTAFSLGPVQEVVTDLNRIMRVWLRDLSLRDMIPKHGGGSVAEGKLTLYEKYKALNTDVYFDVVFGDSLSSYSPCPIGRNLERVSRTIFVPKTFSKLRTISMEPVTLQYFQQGIMEVLYSFIGHHPYLGSRIKLRDQTQNQELAREGSVSNHLATIDLSAASDSVSWALVKDLFAGTPLLKWLYVTRSKKTLLPTGEVIELHKFAPMGSALCFPIECLVFASVIEHVAQKWCTPSGAGKPFYSVYGDDLVVPTTIVEEVIQTLQMLGFVVNLKKSFIDGPFRESCGRDYYDGIDVSSVYYRLPAYNGKSLTPEVYAALCSTINFCVERDLPILRSHLLEKVLPLKPYFTNTVSEAPSLFSPYPTNFHVRPRWSNDLQQWQGRFCTVLSKPVERPTSDGDDVAYFVRLCQMARRKSASLDEDIRDIPLHGTQVLLGHVRREVEVCNSSTYHVGV